jgi:(p)ppGpp synthase/HD superfamily hydrolase
MHPYAQTNVQLFKELGTSGYTAEDLQRIHNAYLLAMQLFSGRFRGSGKTFLAHLVGTASILASVDAPATVVAAGLLHAAYTLGDFRWGGKHLTQRKRRHVERYVGDAVEEYVYRYTLLRWNDETIRSLSSNIQSLSSPERDVLLIRLANELEDHLDLNVLYSSDSQARQQHVARNGTLMVQLADELRLPRFAKELSRVFNECLVAKIPTPLRSEFARSFVMPPRSFRRRLPAVIHYHLLRRLGILLSATRQYRHRIGRQKKHTTQ